MDSNTAPTSNSQYNPKPAGNDDDATDHIGSDTPRSGVATPRPDPVDKRLPGIMHSYFGQVGTGSSTRTSSVLPEPQATTSEDASNIPTASIESVGESRGEDDAMRSIERGVFPLSLVDGLNPYPTPPESATASLHELKLGDASSEGCPAVSRPSYSRSKTNSEAFSHHKKSSSLNPLSSIVTASNVHASHISNPTSSTSSPKTPSHPLFASTVSAESSYESLKRLTGDAGLPRKKSNPPTPTRALSDQTATSDTPSHASDVAPIPVKTRGPEGAPLHAVKGRLTIKIVEARGLRRCKDPYVVAVFQRNELVSKGPRLESDDETDEAVKMPPMGGIPISRTGSDTGRSMAIPMRSRQSSTTSMSEYRDFKGKTRGKPLSNPKWDTEALFDVVGEDSSVNISLYDRGGDAEEFLGSVELHPQLDHDGPCIRSWFPLEGKMDTKGPVTGDVFVEVTFQRTEKKHYGPEDFTILKLIGKGTFGQVYQVRKKDTKRIYAMKVLSKKVIVQKKEVAHTVGERNILVRTAMTDSPFIVGLKFSFQTPTDLYFVTDYMSGGELFWHLQKEGRFDEKRAKFYIAELILALQHLHMHDIVYRDLKPENILLDANGHIALCDFGLSKANLTKNATTNTFCGTTEYLAPEVLLDEQGYTKMVDFWSLGVLVFEMCCGWSPFYAEDTQQMYKNIAFGKVRFPRDTLTTEGRNFVKGLLNRNPKHRLGAIDDAEELKRHPFFADVDWEALAKKLITPPFKPKLKSETDTSNFDPEFTNALNGAGSLNARAAALASGIATSTPLSPTMQANFKGFTFVDEGSLDEHMRDRVRHDDYEDEMDEDWDDADASLHRRGDRMSGIVRTTTNEDSNMFNGGHFEGV